MRSGGEEMQHCRKKTENGQVLTAGEREMKASDEPSRMLQLSLAWGCQLAQKHVLGVERT